MAWNPPRPAKNVYSGRQFSTGGREVVRMSVHGIDGVVSNLYGAAGDVKERCQAAALRAMRRIAALARQRVPVRSGLLRRSITERLSDEGLAFEVYCDPAAFAAAKKPYYPPHVNYGTVRQAANPFLTGSAAEVWPDYNSDIRAAVRAGMSNGGTR
jgi:hypothetical protein